MQGATQIKLMAGGGVTSAYDPIHTIQYTKAELEAAVRGSGSLGHLRPDPRDQRRGREPFDRRRREEHRTRAYMSTRETLQRIKSTKGSWLSMQPFLNDDSAPALNEFQQAKYDAVVNGTDFVYRTAKELGVKIAFGTDVLFSAELAKKQGEILAKLGRWFTPFETLKMATCDNAELLKLSGELTPYPQGTARRDRGRRLCRHDPGRRQPAGRPRSGGQPRRQLRLIIMKDGVIYKNTLN